MVTDTTTLATYLVPDRHPQRDIFVCDVADAVIKDIMPQMEHPVYGLSKTPEKNTRRYEHNGHWLELRPGPKGLATIYDKDILIFCISQIMAAKKNGLPVSKHIKINCRELLTFINRGTSGRDYQALQDAIDRLDGTRIATNIQTGQIGQQFSFGLIDASMTLRHHGLDGRLIACELVLSDWVFNAISHNEVLALHPNYFRLRKPLERRVYEIARKHCGQQSDWKISLPLLLKKTGSQSPEKRFRQMVKALSKTNHLPDYYVHYEADGDMVLFNNRDTMNQKDDGAKYAGGMLQFETYSEVKNVIGRWAVVRVEQEWRKWVHEHDMAQHIKNPDKHFISFAATWYKKRGEPR